jgi:hypothetical protein
VKRKGREPLWRCADCGRGFANRNQTHSCVRLDLAHHFSGKPREIRALYDAFVREVRKCGPVRTLPEKSRIAFQVRISFARLTPRKAWLDGHLVLARRLEDPRFRRIESLSPRNHVHHFRITAAAELDGTFRAWLREAYAVGEQKHIGR